jgi:4-amino-4-deoxy-L-arabinose transferase-like glycosyltransferase
MPLGEYLEGLAFFVPTLAACGFAATWIALRRYSHLRGSERVLAFALLLSLAVLAAHVLPLALGALSRGAVVAAALAIAGASLLVRPAENQAAPAPAPAPPPAGPASTCLALAGVAAAAVYVVAQLRTTLVTPVTHVDVVSFHLPGVARWIQGGSLWQVDQLFPEHVTAFYPNNGDALLLSVVLPWREVAFARLLPILFLGLAALAVYACVRRLGSSRPTAALAGAALMALPATLIYALEGMPDAMMLFGFAVGILFLLRYRDSAASRDLVLAGLGLGLAFGTKWYGLTTTAAVFVVWVGARLLAHDAWKRVARDGLVLLALIAVASGTWFVRNLVETGNPIFPQEVGALGITIFEGTTQASVDQFGFRIVDYLDEPGVLADYAAPGLWAQLGLAGPLLLAGVISALVAGVVALRRGGGEGNRQIVALGALALLVTATWMITPGSAPGFPGQPQVLITVRWLGPAILLGLVVLGGIGGRLGGAAVAVEALLAAAIVHGLDKVYFTRTAGQLAEAAAIVLVAVGTAAAVWLALPRVRALSMTGRRSVAIAAAALAVLAAAAFARWEQSAYAGRDYSIHDPAFAWISENARPGTRIGIAGGASLEGVSPILPAFGPRLRNEVTYVGPFVDDLLLDYEQRDEFVSALRREETELLIVGRGLIPKPEVRQERWARSAGYRLVTESSRLALYAAPASDLAAITPAPGRSEGHPSGSS